MNPSLFVYRLIAPRTTFVADMTEVEKAIMGEHAAYWKELFESGRVVVFGVVIEPAAPWGLAVVEADSEDQVRAIGSADPAVNKRLCTFEIGVMPSPTVRPRPSAA